MRAAAVMIGIVIGTATLASAWEFGERTREMREDFDRRNEEARDVQRDQREREQERREQREEMRERFDWDRHGDRHD